MQSHIAEALLALIGQPGKLEHSISGAEVGKALTKLNEALTERVDIEDEHGDDKQEREHVSLHARATPLKEMLQHAKQVDSYVMWRPE